MFFDELPPDTSTYMIAGYAIFFIVSAIYLVSFFLRERNLNRDLSTLETLQDEQQAQPTPKPAPLKPAPPRQQAKPKASRTKTTKAGKPQKKSARKR